jgi:hypothetical protein
MNKPRNQIPKRDWGKIVNSGMGGFLDPPTYPTHAQSVHSVYDDTFSCSLPSAASSEWLDRETATEAARIIANWQKPPIDSPEIRDWIEQVLGYFANSYSLDGKTRNIDKSETKKGNPFKIGVNRHLGVMLIRRFYPDYTPTQTDFKNAYWGDKKQVSALAT